MTPNTTPNRSASSTVGSAAAPEAARPGVTFERVKDHPRVKVFVRHADDCLAQIGYTEHGERHVGLVAHIAFNVLKRLGHLEREAELAAIAAYLIKFDGLDALRHVGASVDGRIFLVGGGSRSAAYRRRAADLSGTRVTVPDTDETVATGAAAQAAAVCSLQVLTKMVTSM